MDHWGRQGKASTWPAMGGGAFGGDREGLQLGQFRVGSLAIFLFDASIGFPKGCELREGGHGSLGEDLGKTRKSFNLARKGEGGGGGGFGGDREGLQFGPFRVGSFAFL